MTVFEILDINIISYIYQPIIFSFYKARLFCGLNIINCGIRFLCGIVYTQNFVQHIYTLNLLDKFCLPI